MVAREEEIRVAAYAKVAADRVVLSLELRPRQALSSICSLELDPSLIPRGVSYAELSSELMKELKGMAKKVDGILQDKCLDHFFVAATRVLNHLLLRDPSFKFDELMGPVPEESRNDLAAAMEGHVNTLLGKFFCSDGEEDGEEPPVIVLKYIVVASRRCQMTILLYVTI
ncbi:hypothetical protein D1007_35180 [Hordeum vulgare]|nr:hypothetical protein D1007_35180 [Hordeum vulgare]